MSNRVSPIGPEEVKKLKTKNIPDVVFEVFNELIAQNYWGGSATVKQDDVVAMLVKRGVNRSEIFDKHWLDIEDLYRAKGWKVTYDKPAYNEDYPATFTFESKRKRTYCSC